MEGVAVRGRAVWRVLTLALFLVFMLVPLLATVLFSVSTRWDRSIWPEGLTLRWWQAVTARSAFQDTLLNSLAVAAATVAVSIVLSRRRRIGPTAGAEAKPWIEFAIALRASGVVLALAYPFIPACRSH
jgi:putative spermidine/putrescine transport system permease protein